MRIYQILLGLGAFLLLYSPVIMTIGVHNHPPGEFLYRSKILEAEVANDTKQEKLLREDHKAATRRIRKIQEDTTWSLLIVFGAGIVNLFCGAYLRQEVKRADLAAKCQKQGAESGPRE